MHQEYFLPFKSTACAVCEGDWPGTINCYQSHNLRKHLSRPNGKVPYQSCFCGKRGSAAWFCNKSGPCLKVQKYTFRNAPGNIIAGLANPQMAWPISQIDWPDSINHSQNHSWPKHPMETKRLLFPLWMSFRGK